MEETDIEPTSSIVRCRTISVPEAAKWLGVGRSLAYESVRRGKIPAIRIGHQWRVPIVALQRMLEEGAR